MTKTEVRQEFSFLLLAALVAILKNGRKSHFCLYDVSYEAMILFNWSAMVNLATIFQNGRQMALLSLLLCKIFSSVIFFWATILVCKGVATINK